MLRTQGHLQQEQGCAVASTTTNGHSTGGATPRSSFISSTTTRLSSVCPAPIQTTRLHSSAPHYTQSSTYSARRFSQSAISPAYDVTVGQLLLLPAFNQKKRADAVLSSCFAYDESTTMPLTSTPQGRKLGLPNSDVATAQQAALDMQHTHQARPQLDPSQLQPTHQQLKLLQHTWKGPLLPPGTWAIGMDLTISSPLVRSIDLINSVKFLRNGCAQVPPSSTHARIDNLLWRKWWQTQHSLPEVSPSVIQWRKHLDVTYVIGTVYVVADSAVETAMTTVESNTSGSIGNLIAAANAANATNSTTGACGGLSPPIFKHRESVASVTSISSRLSMASTTSFFSATPPDSRSSSISSTFSNGNSSSSTITSRGGLDGSDDSDCTTQSSSIKPLKSCLKKQPLSVGTEWLEMLRLFKAHSNLSPSEAQYIKSCLIAPLLQSLSTKLPAQPLHFELDDEVEHCPECTHNVISNDCQCIRSRPRKIVKHKQLQRYIARGPRPVLRRASVDSSQTCTFLNPGDLANVDLKIKFDYPGTLRRDGTSQVSFNWTVQQRMSVGQDEDEDEDQEEDQQCFTQDQSVRSSHTSKSLVSPALLHAPFDDSDESDLDDSDFSLDEELFDSGFVHRRFSRCHDQSATTQPPLDSLPEIRRLTNVRIVPTQPTAPSGKSLSDHNDFRGVRGRCVRSRGLTPLSMPMTPALLKLDANTIFLPSTGDVDSQVLIPLMNATLEPSSPRRFSTMFVEAPSVPVTAEEIEYGKRCLDEAFIYYEDTWMNEYSHLRKSTASPSSSYIPSSPTTSLREGAPISPRPTLERPHKYLYHDSNSRLQGSQSDWVYPSIEETHKGLIIMGHTADFIAETTFGLVDTLHYMLENVEEATQSVVDTFSLFWPF
ncbi:hypothetical protein BASA50_004920 [Batrachochytrium salamandrivorans]|uniref:Nitrogen regulatory protein areA GATA-like domain-containing protein n=1 Tax=Batrachochytrium salamandrivorans TaxID=1357716 RepID=A0ABQ8FE66_9FUNG|nr:hypothetical protein BASA60_010358 [Batrachochytrium salamandrivorans]KAH6596774.1 hypothetical protein BASA50_004920 [Batrachochytrium salamandrivorans]KAH9267149.1 hypothetical protein BASA83_010177 [Batrachochytrium salamandrivorans]